MKVTSKQFWLTVGIIILLLWNKIFKSNASNADPSSVTLGTIPNSGTPASDVPPYQTPPIVPILDDPFGVLVCDSQKALGGIGINQCFGTHDQIYSQETAKRRTSCGC